MTDDLHCCLTWVKSASTLDTRQWTAASPSERKQPMNLDAVMTALDAAVRSPNHTFLADLAEPPDADLDENRYVEVDVHFFTCWVVKDAAAEVESTLREYVGTLDPELMASGPSYIALGAEIGDQSMALRLMAFGETAGWWQVITPARLGIEGAQADQMAGMGYVMVTPPKISQAASR